MDFILCIEIKVRTTEITSLFPSTIAFLNAAITVRKLLNIDYSQKMCHMNKLFPVLILLSLIGCSKTSPSVDEMLPPESFNLNTVITDANGNSLDLAGDWAVFQDPDETKFTNYLHYDQTTETVFSIKENDTFMLEFDQGKESLPVYDNGSVDKRRSLFIQGATRKLIYKDGCVHTDYRDVYRLYNAAYSSPDLHVIIDNNTITLQDLPNVRLRRIKNFQE